MGMGGWFHALIRGWLDELGKGWRVLRQAGPGQVQFWIIALLVGIASGYAALGFLLAIIWLQELFYGADDLMLASHAAGLAWYRVLFLPILGGLAVGLILARFTPDGRSRGVADVIWGAAMGNGRVGKKTARASAAASLITLSTGGSTGREGPVVHIAAALSTSVSDFIRADGITARDLMGCAVAAAIGAVFNAPLAGTLFALEVVLRHFAVHAFAPIAIASVAGAVVGRLHNGEATEFMIPTQFLGFYAELPAFMILGLVCGLVAVAMMRGIFMAEDVGNAIQLRLGLPIWIRPAVAGALLGLIALKFPHIIGVGYETVTHALTGKLTLLAAVTFVVVKCAAVAITMGGRMGGGVFSPSLMVGALTGMAFGLIATSAFPGVSGSETLYALAGMGAVAAAVLGSPISTTLIVFELTGDWQVGIVVLVTVSLATILSSRMVDRSFFLTQLERRNVHLADGPQAFIPSMISVQRVMRPLEPDWTESDADKLAEGAWIASDATLETALPQLDASGAEFLPVADHTGTRADTQVGRLYLVDALREYNRALIATAREEHS